MEVDQHCGPDDILNFKETKSEMNEYETDLSNEFKKLEMSKEAFYNFMKFNDLPANGEDTNDQNNLKNPNKSMYLNFILIIPLFYSNNCVES